MNFWLLDFGIIENVFLEKNWHAQISGETPRLSRVFVALFLMGAHQVLVESAHCISFANPALKGLAVQAVVSGTWLAWAARGEALALAAEGVVVCQ